MKDARFAAHMIRCYHSVIGQLTVIDKGCIFAWSIITYYIAIVYGELYRFLHPSKGYMLCGQPQEATHCGVGAQFIAPAWGVEASHSAQFIAPLTTLN